MTDKEKPKKIVFLGEWASLIGQLPQEERLTMYEGVMAYAFSGTKPEFGNVAQRLMFDIIKKVLDRNNRMRLHARDKKTTGVHDSATQNS